MRKKFNQLLVMFTTGQEDVFHHGELEISSDDFIVIHVKEGLVEQDIEYIINLKLVNLFKLIN